MAVVFLANVVAGVGWVIRRSMPWGWAGAILLGVLDLATVLLVALSIR